MASCSLGKHEKKKPVYLSVRLLPFVAFVDVDVVVVCAVSYTVTLTLSPTWVVWDPVSPMLPRTGPSSLSQRPANLIPFLSRSHSKVQNQKKGGERLGETKNPSSNPFFPLSPLTGKGFNPI